MMTPGPNHQSFVIHDVARDQSFHHKKRGCAIGFYSGSPLVIHGYVVGALCLIPQKAKRNYGRIQEAQQE